MSAHPDSMSREEWRSVIAARRLMAEALEREHPTRARPLYVVAVAGALADIISKSPAGPAIVDVINQQLAGAGYEVRKLPRN